MPKRLRRSVSPIERDAIAQRRRQACQPRLGLGSRLVQGRPRFHPPGARLGHSLHLMCDARLYQPSIYSSDGFHPNDAGYAILAGEVVQAATSSSYPAPQGSCAQTTLVR